MAWRTAGKVGWGDGPLILFFRLVLQGGDAGGRRTRSLQNVPNPHSETVEAQ
jgi:hypothetical protein